MPASLPDIFFVVLDTHRLDRLGCYGYGRGTSPNLDDFARRATLYENAIAPAQWTIPSHASMFSGELPAAHQTIQASDALRPVFPTLAELLGRRGYQSVGFCNNPLVGVLDNGLKRGFDRFHNYGGPLPNPPSSNGHSLFTSLYRGYRSLLERVAHPIQQTIAASADVFQSILHPRLVALWTRYANFKGNTAASIADVARYWRSLPRHQRPPQFVFLNLMETHLPYMPPAEFQRRYAPIVKDEPAAREFMRIYNTQALRWLLPLAEPYSEVEAQTLSQMYDAEVAYQDHLLAPLLAWLDAPEQRENTLVVIVADHGEMLGEHRYMGHGLSVFEELVHVPLMVRYPGQVEGERRKEAVSTRQLFHTLLEGAGITQVAREETSPVETAPLSLRSRITFDAQHPAPVVSEAYPPANVIQILRRRDPALLRAFQCEAVQRAVYALPYKLTHIEGVGERLYDLVDDPHEDVPLANHEDVVQKLKAVLQSHLAMAAARRPTQARSATGNLHDPQVMDRLRGLGYME